MYVDESGDPGKAPLSSPHFILSGLIIHINDWEYYLKKLKQFRLKIKQTFGLNLRTEIHAAELIRIQKLSEYKRIRKSDRLSIIKEYCTELPNIFDRAALINVCLNIKDFRDEDIFNLAWSRLFNEYNNYLIKKQSCGLIISDDTSNVKLMTLQRNLNQSSISQPSEERILTNIIEDTFYRQSNQSYFLQSCDVIAHMLYRMEYPKGSLKKFGIEHQFKKFKPLLVNKNSEFDEFGIIRK
jgi:hypothetical protein